jgi:AraC-like DNA-binding protein
LLRSDTAFSDYARNVREAEVDFIVTDRGRNDWSVRRCTVGGSVLQFGRAAAGTIANGVMAQSDVIVFVVQNSLAPHRVWLNGKRIASHGIAVLPPGSNFVFANQVPHEWISFSVGLDRLPPRAIDRFDEQIELRAAALLATEDARFAELVRAAEAGSRWRMGSVPSVCCPTDSEDELIDALTSAVTTLKSFRFDQERRDARHYYGIVRHALAGIPDGGSVHVDDLCRSVGIEGRTLRRAFNDVFSMPPVRYLKLRQLNEVHAALCAAEARGQLVTDILTRHGVTELGRFAAEYRALFGELPSQTFRRRPGARV